MRNFNLPALLASLLVHTVLFGWIVSHSGPSQPEGAAFHQRVPLTVTLLEKKSGKPAAEKQTAVTVQPLPAPLAEEQPMQQAATISPETDYSADKPAANEDLDRSAFHLPFTYYPARALSKMPQAISKFEPHPPATGDTGTGGKLSIRLWIDASGHLDQIIVLNSDLPPAFDEAALAAFRQMRFAPAEINGVAVGALVEVVIEYADLLQQAGSALPGNREPAQPAPAPQAGGNDGRPQ